MHGALMVIAVIQVPTMQMPLKFSILEKMYLMTLIRLLSNVHYHLQWRWVLIVVPLQNMKSGMPLMIQPIIMLVNGVHQIIIKLVNGFVSIALNWMIYHLRLHVNCQFNNNWQFCTKKSDMLEIYKIQ